MTPRELLSRKPREEVKLSADHLVGCRYNHVPEIEDYRQYGMDWGKAERVAVRIYREHYFDFRRFWRLASIHLDGAPVMIVQNAGREGDDFSRRFVVDENLYREMVKYLLTFLTPVDKPAETVGMDQEMNQDLTRFYGSELDGYFEIF